MAVELNHTIVPSNDGRAGATWFAEMFGLPEPEHWGPFWQVTTGNGVALDWHEGRAADFPSIHYAFLVTDAEFDDIYGRIVDRGVDHYADPGGRERGVNTHDGGRGTYFHDPDGHWLEIITRPYGSGM